MELPRLEVRKGPVNHVLRLGSVPLHAGALLKSSKHWFILRHYEHRCNALPILRIRTDPLVGHGRHFGRTIRTFCRIHTLITNGLSRNMQLELGRLTEEDLSAR